MKPHAEEEFRKILLESTKESRKNTSIKINQSKSMEIDNFPGDDDFPPSIEQCFGYLSKEGKAGRRNTTLKFMDDEFHKKFIPSSKEQNPIYHVWVLYAYEDPQSGKVWFGKRERPLEHALPYKGLLKFKPEGPTSHLKIGLCIIPNTEHNPWKKSIVQKESNRGVMYVAEEGLPFDCIGSKGIKKDSMETNYEREEDKEFIQQTKKRNATCSKVGSVESFSQQQPCHESMHSLFVAYENQHLQNPSPFNYYFNQK